MLDGRLRVFFPPELDMYMDICKVTERVSTCSRAKVACILLWKWVLVAAAAANGTLDGQCRRPEQEGNCGCLHAEVRAALQLANRPATAAIVSRAPCERCALVLAEVGVTNVFYLEESRPMVEGLAVFRTHNIVSHLVTRRDSVHGYTYHVDPRG